MTDTDPGASGRGGAAPLAEDGRGGRSRRLRAALAAGAVVAVVAVVALADGVRRDDGTARADGGVASVPAVPAVPAAAGPVPSGPAAAAPPADAPSTPGAAPTDVPVAPASPVGVEVMTPVGVGDGVGLGDLEAVVVSVRSVRVVPHGPGEVAGPAAAVDLRVRNTSQAPADLAGLVVTASSRDGSTPAVPAGGDPASPLGGSLAPGEERSGTYVFTTGVGTGDPVGSGAPSLRLEIGLDTAPGVATVLSG